MIKKRKHTKKKSKAIGDAATLPPGICAASGRQETRLQLPPGEPDLEFLRSATREWLVPQLVERFLRLHGVQPRKSTRKLVTSTKPTTFPFSRKDLLM